MHSKTVHILVMTVFLIATSGLAMAQRTTATFAGIVADPTGAVLPGAQAQLINEGTSAVTQQVTGETGEFVFNFVPAGTYTLKIELPGFKTYQSRGIPLGAAQNVRRTYTLEVGNLTDNVTVTGEAPLVNTLSTEQRLSLETTEVKNLPMVNRNITNVLTLGAGLTKADAGADATGQTSLRLNGLGSASISIMTDGTDSNANPGSASISQYGGTNKIDQMSTESIAEVQIIKGVMPAEYGAAMAGAVSLITKSGTNEWHGSLFHRYEGSALSARPATLTVEPNSVWNQFGGSVSGPIKKDRAFFFFAYEGYRQRTSVALDAGVYTPYLRDIILTSLPFPQTKEYLSFYPLPNQPYGPTDTVARWVGPGAKVANDDHNDWKLDYLIGGGNLSLSHAGGHPYQNQPRESPLNPQEFQNKNRRMSLNYSIGRGAWTSSTRVGYNKNFLFREELINKVRDPTNPSLRLPEFAFTGVTGGGVGGALNSERHSRGQIPGYSFEQQIALIRGRHSFKFGGILSLPAGGKDETKNQEVVYQTVSDIQQNQPSQVVFAAIRNPFLWRHVDFAAFMQDDWRVSRRLVLNLGLRYDRFDTTTVNPVDEKRAVIVPNLNGLLNQQTFQWGPLRDPVTSSYNPDNLSLGPRFGFAYTLGGTSDFVLRGGYGINFQPIDVQITIEQNIAQSLYIPNSVTYTRAEALTYGLKYPLHNEEVTKLTETLSAGKATVGNRMDVNMHPSYAMNYTLGIQRAITSSLVLETAYVGTRGVKLRLARTFNKADRLTGVRPNPTDVSATYNDGSQQTVYHSWQTSLKKRFTRGLLFNVHHTWGKGLSYTGANVGWGDTIGSVDDFQNVKIERGPANGDTTHNVTADLVYTVPTPFAGSPVARQVLGGWQISSIWSGRTGIPIVISQSGGRPDIVNFEGAVNKACCSFGNLQYLNPDAFQLVEINRASSLTVRRGNAGAAPLRGPGLTNLNISLGKSIALGEGRNLEFRTDMLNALNQTQYTTILTNMSGVNFGKAVGTASARVIQLQLRLTF